MFKSLYTVPKYFMGRTKQVSCKERSRLFKYFELLNAAQVNHVVELLPRTDLDFCIKYINNSQSLNQKFGEIQRIVLDTIKIKLDEITPQRAVDLSVALIDYVQAEDQDLCKELYLYVQENGELFTKEQVMTIEKAFFGITRRITLHFTPYFADLIQKCVEVGDQSDYSFSTLANEDVTQYLLASNGIDVPKGLEVQVTHDQSIVRILVKDSNKIIILAGIDPLDWKSIYMVKEMTEKFKFDNIMLGLPPITKESLDQVHKETDSKRERVIDKFITDDFLKSIGQSYQDNTRNQYLKFFDKYDKLPIFDGELLEWYYNNILLNKKKFKIEESERIVYTNYQGLSKPDPFATLMYILNLYNFNDIKILFTEMDSNDELSKMAGLMSNEDAKGLFSYGRFSLLMENIDFICKVNKNGCPHCSPHVKRMPRELDQLLHNKRLHYGIKDNFSAQQILDYVQLYDGKRYAGLFDKDRLLSITRSICNIFKESKEPIVTKNGIFSRIPEAEKFENFLRFEYRQDINKKFDEESIQQHTNKLALLSSIFLNEREAKTPQLSNIDPLLFNDLVSNYRRFLTIDSFLKEDREGWEKYKQEQKCFVVHNMFHKKSNDPNFFSKGF